GSFHWYDALYVNQVNSEERAQQVRLMQLIYSNAELVIAWLGEYRQEMFSRWTQ
ncbi:hypothetical protein N431DRAFT_351352, partial [Stipitochalara longipes BDJ]